LARIMEAMSPMARFVIALALAAGALVAPVGCAFPPDLGEGRIHCASDGSCPPDYHCAVDKRCYKSGGPDLGGGGVADMSTKCLPTCNVACSPCCQETCANMDSCEVDCPVGGCDCRMGCVKTKSCSLNCNAQGRCTGTVVDATTAELTCNANSSCNFVC